MRKTLAVVAFVAVVPALAGQDPAPAGATATPPNPKPATLGLFVHPGSGQDTAKQAADEGECYAWARQQTGIDPTAAPTPVAAAEAPKGGAVKGAARGAARGAVVGAVSDETPHRGRR